MENTNLKLGYSKSVGSKKLFVRYMVSMRCKKIVRAELKNLNISSSITPHGCIEFFGEITPHTLAILKNNLLNSGLILLDEASSRLLNQIIDAVVDTIHKSDELPRLSYKEIGLCSPYVSSDQILKLFSDVKGTSLLQFIISQKIERVKDLLVYHNYSLSEIAHILNYASENLMAAQFEKHTGLSPQYFKYIKKARLRISGNNGLRDTAISSQSDLHPN